jgi:hypothetical protein
VGAREGGGSALDFLVLFVCRVPGDELGLLKLDADVGSGCGRGDIEAASLDELDVDLAP